MVDIIGDTRRDGGKAQGEAQAGAGGSDGDTAPTKKPTTNFLCVNAKGCDAFGNSKCPKKYCVLCCVAAGGPCKAHAKSKIAAKVEPASTADGV